MNIVKTALNHLWVIETERVRSGTLRNTRWNRENDEIKLSIRTCWHLPDRKNANHLIVLSFKPSLSNFKRNNLRLTRSNDFAKSVYTESTCKWLVNASFRNDQYSRIFDTTDVLETKPYCLDEKIEDKGHWSWNQVGNFGIADRQHTPSLIFNYVTSTRIKNGNNVACSFTF